MMLLSRDDPTGSRSNPTIVQIHDVEAALFMGCLAAGSFLAALVAFPSLFTLIFGGIGAFWSVVAYNRYAGFEFDFGSGLVTFPGGNVAANNADDLASWSYWLQSAHRITINLSDIELVEVVDDESSYTDDKGRLRTRSIHSWSSVARSGRRAIFVEGQGAIKSCPRSLPGALSAFRSSTDRMSMVVNAGHRIGCAANCDYPVGIGTKPLPFL